LPKSWNFQGRRGRKNNDQNTPPQHVGAALLA